MPRLCVAGQRAGDVLRRLQAGFRFGRLGLNLVEKRGLDRFSARVYLVLPSTVVTDWTQDLSISRAFCGGLSRRRRRPVIFLM